MTPVILLLSVVMGSVLITRIGATALEITGLSRQASIFQARSAYTTCGFTTSEAEKVVNHPVRRHIAMFLMLLGHLGLGSVAGTVLLTALEFDSSRWMWNLAILLIGFGIVLFLGMSSWVGRTTEKSIRWCLLRFTKLETLDYSGLMHLTGGYVVSEMSVRDTDWLANKTLRELLLSKEGVLVLGIEKADGTYVGVPEGYHMVEPEDVLIVYGDAKMLRRLDQRRSGAFGDVQHAEAVREKLTVEQKVNEEMTTGRNQDSRHVDSDFPAVG